MEFLIEPSLKELFERVFYLALKKVVTIKSLERVYAFVLFVNIYMNS